MQLAMLQVVPWHACISWQALRGAHLALAWVQDAGEAYLVDPKFKEQFEIAHPTERYTELLDALPAFFVGTEDRLVTLVELLCSEMSAAFQSTGTQHAFSTACESTLGIGMRSE